MNSDFLRLLVTASFAFGILILYQRWLEFSKPEVELTTTSSAQTEVTIKTEQAEDPTLPQVTQSLQADNEAKDVAASATPTTSSTLGSDREVVATISNDYIEMSANQRGDLVLALLLRHTAQDHETPLALLVNNSSNQYIAQSGLIGEGLPSHQEEGWSTTLVNADGTSQIVSKWSSTNLEVSRTYFLTNNSYVGTVSYTLTNTSDQPIRGHVYYQYLRDRNSPPYYSALLPSYFGAAIYTDEEKYNKYSFDDFENYPKRTSDGWLGIVQRYFMAAWLDGGGERENYLNYVGQNYVSVGKIRPLGTIEANSSYTIDQPFFVGALEQDLLDQIDPSIAPNISLAVDYGWLSIICRPLFLLLNFIHNSVGNWGLSIIGLTFLIKLVFFPLMTKSYRSMARLKAVAPQMQKLKERHGDDKQALQQAMLEMYRKEKINPLGGCLPILVQIPVFIALYWMLLESIELRHAPFYGWITDLTATDPYFILPVLLGIAMFGQFKLNPTPPDPTQAMIMKIMPIGFAGFSIFFPAGLVIYWLTNTILSVAQQWYITKKLVDSKQKK